MQLLYRNKAEFYDYFIMSQTLSYLGHTAKLYLLSMNHQATFHFLMEILLKLNIISKVSNY